MAKERLSTAEKIAELEKKVEQLKARKTSILARETQKKRKADTRAKIILGGLWLTIARRSPEEAKKFLKEIEKEKANLRPQDAEALTETIGEIRELTEKKTQPELTEVSK